MKKLILSINLTALITLPVMSTISCGDENEISKSLNTQILINEKSNFIHKVNEFRNKKTKINDVVNDLNVLLNVNEELITRDSNLSLNYSGNELTVTKYVNSKVVKTKIQITYIQTNIVDFTRSTSDLETLVNNFNKNKGEYTIQKINSALNIDGIININSSLKLNKDKTELTITNPDITTVLTINYKLHGKNITLIKKEHNVNVHFSKEEIKDLITKFNNSKGFWTATAINNAIGIPGLVESNSIITINNNGLIITITNGSIANVVNIKYYLRKAIKGSVTLSKVDFKNKINEFISDRNLIKVEELNNSINISGLFNLNSQIVINSDGSTLVVTNDIDGVVTENIIEITYHERKLTQNIISTSFSKFKEIINNFQSPGGNTITNVDEINKLLNSQNKLVNVNSRIKLSSDGLVLIITNASVTNVVAIERYQQVTKMNLVIHATESIFRNQISKFNKNKNLENANALNSKLNINGLITENSIVEISNDGLTLLIRNTVNNEIYLKEIKITYTQIFKNAVMNISKINFKEKITKFNESKTIERANELSRLLSKNNNLIATNSLLNLSDDGLTLVITDFKNGASVKTTISLTYHVSITNSIIVNISKDDFKALINRFNNDKNEANSKLINNAIVGNDGLVVDNSEIILSNDGFKVVINSLINGEYINNILNITYKVTNRANVTIHLSKEDFQEKVSLFHQNKNIYRANAINVVLGLKGVILANSVVTLSNDGTTITIENRVYGLITINIITINYNG